MKRTLTFVRDEVAHKDRFVSVVHRHFVDAAGAEQIYEVVQCNKGKQFVVILPVTEDGHIVLLRQQRVNLVDDSACGDDRYCVRTFELPAGFVGKNKVSDAEVVAAATHELKEETGYCVVGSPVILARHVPCEVGRNDGEVSLVFARVKRESGQALEDSEVIDVHLVPVSEIFDYLDGKPYVDSHVYAALAIARNSQLI